MLLKPSKRVGINMKITAKTEYGIRAIIEIALKENKPATVNEIARKQKMPGRFLEQVMAILKKEDIVKSLRGAHGGYILALKPEEITLKQVIQAIEGPMALVDCLEDENGSSCIEVCTIKDVFEGVQSVILEALDSITIKDLIDKKVKRKSGGKYAQAISK